MIVDLSIGIVNGDEIIARLQSFDAAWKSKSSAHLRVMIVRRGAVSKEKDHKIPSF